MKRARAQAGETLPETLIALLIVVTTFLFLTGAVVTAGRVNASIENDTYSFRAEESESAGSGSVTITMGSSGTASVPAVQYKSYVPEDALEKLGNGFDGYVYYR